ncbi:type VII secretion target [Saccharomonospora xinjiangensis]|uniref:Excreted virulence factor EspC, type VII ESX diderm n=1 Tax=Saccharomonospora xinjiangensis XJ-54 TaxID=882086 RepID=I0V217_9PSEU|nr:type VII secretion target [Saccharomonospora xinjiangensis]EID54170.1 Protein of unknown function (DUF2580) [Saccharomonospora xinjiangensis XJ-54]QBQ58525.1 hypothetical protein EYD13_00675 [Saccharomonospora xinjiangensis]
MGAPGYQVDPQKLRDHAGTIATIKAEVAEAGQAGHYVSGLDDAYGAILRMMYLPTALKDAQERVAGLIDSVGTQLEGLSDKLSTAAEKYETGEKESQERLKRPKDDIDRTDIIAV